MNKLMTFLATGAIGLSVLTTSSFAADIKLKMLTAWGGNHSGTANMAQSVNGRRRIRPASAPANAGYSAR